MRVHVVYQRRLGANPRARHLRETLLLVSLERGEEGDWFRFLLTTNPSCGYCCYVGLPDPTLSGLLCRT